jgi:hypothetical protein
MKQCHKCRYIKAPCPPRYRIYAMTDQCSYYKPDESKSDAPKARERCDNCKYSSFFETEQNGTAEFYYCHRYPPFFVGTLEKSLEVDSYNVPMVYSDWWCGEYKMEEK